MRIDSAQRTRTCRLNLFLFLSFTATLANMTGYLSRRYLTEWSAVTYLVSVLVTYSVLYFLPVLAICGLLNRFVPCRANGAEPVRPTRPRELLVFAAALGLTTALQIAVLADRTIFSILGMHMNGFVWNTVITPGGIESMGGGTETTVVAVLKMSGVLVLQGVLLLMALRARPVEQVWRRFAGGRLRFAAIGLVASCAVGQGVAYGVSDIVSYSPILSAADVLPLYQPITFRHWAQRMGWQVSRNHSLGLSAAASRVNYPLQPLVIEPPAKPLNLVWLVSESLRADMLDAEIMPATWAFSERAHRFTNHYSGGNGTRMGMFSMFYGLYGNYWFPFLRERRGPVFIDVLQEQGYQLNMITSARFSYPEFDQTVFAKVPSDCLHEFYQGQGWMRDRYNVEQLLKFIDARDVSRPFMSFMFFESPHAKYHFPDESIIRTPYLPDMNYADMNLERDIGLIKNRYVNACHHLDSQLAKVLTYLEEKELLDNTVVVITGDHGEEFMEKGRWGHNSEFTQEQIRPPFVLWVPGRGAGVHTELSSHLDVVPTLLPVLGVQNPPADYCQGVDLLGETRRDFTVVADWSRIAYVDNEYKAVFPIKAGGVIRNVVTDANDAVLANTDRFYESRRDSLFGLMKDLSRFSK